MKAREDEPTGKAVWERSSPRKKHEREIKIDEKSQWEVWETEGRSTGRRREEVQMSRKKRLLLQERKGAEKSAESLSRKRIENRH